jgi:hypothetical protein
LPYTIFVRFRRYSVAKLLFCGWFNNFSGMDGHFKILAGGRPADRFLTVGGAEWRLEVFRVPFLVKSDFGENIDCHQFRVLQQNRGAASTGQRNIFQALDSIH